MRNKIKKQNLRYLTFAAALIFALLAMGGCASAAAAQGWSGCTNGPVNIYCGTMDGRLISINPAARSDERNFPAKDSGEWAVSFTATAAASICGPICGAPGATSVPIYTTPLFTPDYIFVASYGGVLYQFPSASANITEADANGAALHTYPRLGGATLGPIVGNLLLVDNSIYVADATGNIYSFSEENLSQNWELITKDKIWTSPVYANGNIYLGTFNGNIYAITTGGKKVWEVQLPDKSAIASSPAVYKDKIIFGAFDQYLYALNQSDGSVAWKFKGNNWFWAQPVVNNNIVYAACMDGNLYAINADTGAEIWHYNVGGPIASVPVIVNNNIVVATDEPSDGFLYVIDLQNGTLSQPKFEIGYKVYAPLDADQNIVYIHAADDYIYPFDLTTGTLVYPKFKAVVQ